MKLDKKQLWASLIIMLFVGVTVVTIVPMVNVASASPDTYFFVDPPEVRDIPPGGNFTITINVTDAPPSYSWEVYLSWDHTLLNVSGIKEGDFLHRWEEDPFDPGVWYPKYDTTLANTPLGEANLEGEMLVYCTLIGDEPWASGDGWLVSLEFLVKAEGSSVLNLYKTRLWDHMDAGYPAPTYYPNLDGFFYNLAVHDIAISNVTPSPTEVTVGDNVTITVTVKNEGNFPETFNVTVYADVIVYNMTVDWWPDEIVIGDEITIGTQTNITLNAGDSTTLPTFTWNTTGVAGETYTISANATLTSPTDDDPRDNTFIDDTVTVRWDHDIAITNVTASPTKAAVGDNVTITVTVKNEGNFPETFNVTVYYDGTPIETKTGISLENGTSTILTFTWNTTDVAKGTYTIKAEASAVLDEVDTDDNTRIDGAVTLLIPPMVEFTENATTVLTGEVISFDASGSEDPDGSIVSYFWDFGDGTNATGVTVEHAYTDDGTYTVTLTVTDDDGATNSTSAVKTVLNRPPVALFSESAETVDTGVVVTFDASDSYDPDGVIVSYAWDFGDGTDATGVTVEHAYEDDGVYTVTLTITDDDGATASTSAVKTASNRPPVASFTEDATTVNTGEVIHFNASESYDPDGSIVSYFWDFGDGTNATGVTVEHAYTDDGTYTVTLTVTDDDGASSSLTATKTVKTPEGWSLVWYAVIGLGIAALTLIALYTLYRRRKK